MANHTVKEEEKKRERGIGGEDDEKNIKRKMRKRNK